MAFSSRLLSLSKMNFSQNIVSSGQAPVMSMLNAARYMSSKLFIGGLSYNTDDQSLRDAFSSFGDVTEVKVITDRETGRSRGFGFVSYTTDDSASQAMSSMDGKEFDGRNIRVSYANDRPRTGFGGGGYGGSGDFGAQFGNE